MVGLSEFEIKEYEKLNLVLQKWAKYRNFTCEVKPAYQLPDTEKLSWGIGWNKNFLKYKKKYGLFGPRISVRKGQYLMDISQIWSWQWERFFTARLGIFFKERCLFWTNLSATTLKVPENFLTEI